MTDSINTAMVEELKELMEEDFPDLVLTYITDCDDRISKLEQALASDDSHEVRELAHAFKGSSSNLGAEALAEHCYKLETMGREDNLTQAPETFEDIKRCYSEVRAYFSGLLV